MLRLIAALALASVSVVASAADKPLPVTVANPVLPVEVSNADPIPVQIAGSTEEPFTFTTAINISACDCENCCRISTPPVPIGKRLVVRNVSGYVTLSAPGNLGHVNLWQENSSVNSVIATITPVARTIWNGVNYPAWEFNDNVLAFVDAGNTCIFDIFSSVSWGIQGGRVTINGYLVSLP